MAKPLGIFGGEEPFIKGLAGGTGSGSKEGVGGSFGAAAGGPLTKAIEAARESQDSSPEGGVPSQQGTDFYIAPNGNMLTASSDLSLVSTTNPCFRFVALYSITVSKIAFELVNVQAGSIAAGLYDDSDSGALLMSSGVFDSSSGGVKSVTGRTPITLVAGRTYRAYVACTSAGAVTIRSHGNTLGTIKNIFQTIMGRAANGLTGTPDLPASTGALTASSDILPFILVLGV